MVQVTIKELKTLRTKLDDIKKKKKKITDHFIIWANEELDKNNLESRLENSLPQKRLRKKKKMPRKKATDEIISDPSEAFRINIFNVTIDTIVSTL